MQRAMMTVTNDPDLSSAELERAVTFKTIILPTLKPQLSKTITPTVTS